MQLVSQLRKMTRKAKKEGKKFQNGKKLERQIDEKEKQFRNDEKLFTS